MGTKMYYIIYKTFGITLNFMNLGEMQCDIKILRSLRNFNWWRQ